ncbi:MAG: DUF5018 domain-containing protein [Spirochaetaceae bacterium]|jgi:hypothetical protein|nr:DUF5018 domain-containing protein [Spirochaetaceae bacterium]
MKRILLVFLSVFFLASCSNPVLKWIKIPDGGQGRITSQSDGKEIVSFSFDIEGEIDLPIGNNPDSTGKIPIAVILPEGTDARSLSPAVTYIGKSLSPASGEAGDFRSPVFYTVTGEDGSSRDYIVRVYVKDDASKAIVRFAIDVSGGSGTGDSTLTAEGVIDEAAGLITVSVPAETDIKSLTAHITHTGATVLTPLKQSFMDETFISNGDFSSPAEWTVIARDHTTKTYTVTVFKEKSHDKEITHFSFGISGENAIIGGEPRSDGKYPILVVIPDTTLVVNSSLPGNTADITNIAPFVSYRGVSISPGPDTQLNFSNSSNPVPYTVTAEDRSTRDYVVSVIRKDDAFDSLAQITGFYFADPLVEGIIDEAAKTIVLTVPPGTNIGALRPEIYYTGASISPRDGQPKDFTNPVVYTVQAHNGTTQSYTVSVFTAAAPKIDVAGTEDEKVDMGIDAKGDLIIFVELPVYITNPTIKITYGENADKTETKTITNNNVYNNIIMGEKNEYNVIVINPLPDTPSPPAPTDPLFTVASINGFYFVSPLAIGEIGKTDGTEGAGTPANPYRISVTVPYGTDLRNLAATICYTGREIVGIPGPNPLKDNARSFTAPMDYTVLAQDGTNSKTYRVTVTAALNNAKEISAFSFSRVAPTSAMISAAPNANGEYPIVVTVPQGQSIAGLTPVITHTGVSIAGTGIAPPGAFGNPGVVTADSPVTTFNSTTPVKYTVTAEDGSTRTYAVTVRNAAPLEENIEITGFYFTEPLAVGVINQEANTITVSVPSKTNTASLKPAVYFKGMSVKPGSGVVNNFSGPVTYTVTGNNGKTRSYTVTVSTLASSTSDIIRFGFPGIPNTETIIGAVPDADGTYPISVWVPTGTDINNRTPDITHTGVSITPAPGASLNFDAPQTYTVTAEDGSVKTYKVTVGAQNSDSKLITSLVFEEVPLAGGGTTRAVASIDQNAHTIRVELPFSANISALKPVLTYIGKSIAGPGEGDKTANPFTDTARNFSSPQTYTVKDQSGAGQSYTVTVTQKSSIAVNFTGEVDSTVIAANVFDQTTGVITVTVNPANVTAPYEWYVDGVKQPVPNTQETFALNVGDGTFIPGRHEIMVSGKKSGLHYTGKVYFTVAGGTK